MQEKLPDQEVARVLAWLAEKMRCPLCGYRYNLQSSRVVPKSLRNSGDVVVHTNCGECDCALLFALDVRGGEVFLVGVVTDLTFDDALKFQTKGSIAVDEVIDWHKFWHKFDGNLVKALS